MPMMPGYNFVRGRAKREAAKFLREWFETYRPTTVSVVGFLRCLERGERLPHRGLLVEGFDRLWALIDEPAELTRRVHKLLARRANWLQNQNAFVCFALPPNVNFTPGQHLYLRLPDGEQLDLYPIFGPLSQGDSPDHYYKGFNIDS